MAPKKTYTLSEAALALGRSRKLVGFVVLTQDIPHETIGAAVVLDGDGMEQLRKAFDTYDRKVKAMRPRAAVAR